MSSTTAWRGNLDRRWRRAGRFASGAVILATVVGVLEREMLNGLDATPDPDEPPEPGLPTDRAHVIATPDGGWLSVVDRDASDWGTSRPIVLLHGHGTNLGTFDWMADHLVEGGCRVVALDLRGFGRSSAVPDGFDFRGLVDDVALVIEALDLHDAILVGHSMGGAIALGLAVYRSDLIAARVSGMVLVSTTSRGPADTRLNRAQLRALDWEIFERLGNHPRHGLALSRFNFGAAPRRNHVEAAQAIGLGSPVGRRRGFAQRLLGTDLTDQLADVHLPALVLTGSMDRVVAPQESIRLGELLVNSRVQVLAGAGHMLPIERARDVADRTLRFIERLAAADPAVGGQGTGSA